MFFGTYDKNLNIFSPEGEILQLQFANSASNRGNLIFGTCSHFNSYLISICEKTDNLSNPKKKNFSISENLGMISQGVLGDSKFIHKYLQKNKTEYEYSFDRQYPLSLCILDVRKIFFQNTFDQNSRPFGVKIFLAGYDFNGPILSSISPDSDNETNKIIIAGTNINIENIMLEKKFADFEKINKRFSIDENLNGILKNSIQSLKTRKNWSKFLMNSINIYTVGKKTQWLAFNCIFKIHLLNLIKKGTKKKLFSEESCYIRIPECLKIKKLFIQKKEEKRNFYSCLFFIKIQISLKEKFTNKKPM